MLAAVAISVALPAQAAGASSTTATVAVPVNMPAEIPESTRPSSRGASPPPQRNAQALAAEKTSPRASMGRRPS